MESTEAAGRHQPPPFPDLNLPKIQGRPLLPALSELHLRRNFSALFLYGQAANKGGIAAAIVRWSLVSCLE